LSITPVAQQPEDVQLKAVGGSGGNRFKTRCPRNQHLLGFKLRAGDNIDAVQAVCGLAYTATRAEPAVTAMPQLGGTGGNPQGVMCPAATPIVIGARFEAEGIDTQVLNAIRLYCGVAGPAQATIYPDDGYAAEFAAHVQGSGGGIGIGDPVQTIVDMTMCPTGTVAVGIHGRAGKMVDAVGLLCGAAVLTKAPLDAPLGGIAPTNASAVPGPSKTLYIRRRDGSMERVIHTGAADGTRRWERRRALTGIMETGHAFASSSGVLYVVSSGGDLHWYKDTDWDRDGRSIMSGGGRAIVKDLTKFRKFVIADQGVFYTFQDPLVFWNRHSNYLGGQEGVTAPKPVGWERGFGDYVRVFAGGDGIIYGVTADGRLHWMRHAGHASGSDAPGSFLGPLPIASGFGTYTHVFSAGDGIIYGLTSAGELHWYKQRFHLQGRRPATNTKTLGRSIGVLGPQVVEVGLKNVYDIFAMLPGAVDVIR
jgi:hypothetical protein